MTGAGRVARYCPHEEIFESPSYDPQDLLWKFELTGSLRPEALGYLHSHNPTDYSLFGSEESLMDTLAARAFILSG